MSNKITIELCTEDRARLDRLATLLDARIIQAQVALENTVTEANDLKDELQERLENTLKEAAEFVGTDRTTPAAEPQETPAPTDIPKAEEKPTDEEKTAPSNKKTVDRAELRAKVIEVSAKGLKEQARTIVNAYAPTVAAVPEDKITECYEKLDALEG